MDDKPAIDFHPFGTITLNFDETPIKLRRCRLGDLEYAKNLLEEIRAERADQRKLWVDEIMRLRTVLPSFELTDQERIAFVAGLSDEGREELVAATQRTNEIIPLLDAERIDIVYDWLSQVAERMGDANPPPKSEWPLEMLDANTPNEIIDHWQTRPLASGKTRLAQTTNAANNSGPYLHAVSSPQEQPHP